MSNDNTQNQSDSTQSGHVDESEVLARKHELKHIKLKEETLQGAATESELWEIKQDLENLFRDLHNAYAAAIGHAFTSEFMSRYERLMRDLDQSKVFQVTTEGETTESAKSRLKQLSPEQVTKGKEIAKRLSEGSEPVESLKCHGVQAYYDMAKNDYAFFNEGLESYKERIQSLQAERNELRTESIGLFDKLTNATAALERIADNTVDASDAWDVARLALASIKGDGNG